jgi:pimeloyl-ACP methyl ester carboxylesterase
MSTSRNLTVNWTNVPTRTITAGEVEFTYRELGTNNPGAPVVFLVHLAAVLDNWDPRVVDGFAAAHHVITFDNRGIGASSGAPATSIEQMAKDAITFIKAMDFERVDLFGFSMGGVIAQEIVLMEPQLVRKMIIAGTGPAGGEGISKVARVTYLDTIRGLLTRQDPKQFLFFTRTSAGAEKPASAAGRGGRWWRASRDASWRRWMCGASARSNGHRRREGMDAREGNRRCPFLAMRTQLHIPTGRRKATRNTPRRSEASLVRRLSQIQSR